MTTLRLILVVAVALGVVNGAAVPKYLKVCPRKLPEFSKCALESAKVALPHFINGDKSLQIPNLNPLHLPFIQVDASETFGLNLTELEVRGLEKAVPISISADFDKRIIYLELEVPEVILDGKYSVRGRILILPIEGAGPGVFKFYNGKYKYSFAFEEVNKKGVQYAKVTEDSFDFSVQKAQFQLDNLFNGDKKLGDEMNKFLNENWEEIVKDFGKAIGLTVSSICRRIAANLFDKVPFDDFFSS